MQYYQSTSQIWLNGQSHCHIGSPAARSITGDTCDQHGDSACLLWLRQNSSSFFTNYHSIHSLNFFSKPDCWDNVSSPRKMSCWEFKRFSESISTLTVGFLGTLCNCLKLKLIHFSFPCSTMPPAKSTGVRTLRSSRLHLPTRIASNKNNLALLCVTRNDNWAHEACRRLFVSVQTLSTTSTRFNNIVVASRT